MSYKYQQVLWLYFIMPFASVGVGTTIGVLLELAALFVPLPLVTGTLLFGWVIRQIYTGRLRYSDGTFYYNC